MKCDFLQLAVCTNPDAPTNGQHVAPIICRSCKHYEGLSRGFGDTVHKALEATGVHRIVKPCGGCQKRREALNRLVPFKQPEPTTQDSLGDPNE